VRFVDRVFERQKDVVVRGGGLRIIHDWRSLRSFETRAREPRAAESARRGVTPKVHEGEWLRDP
jgi:hypothetical protein